MAIRADNLNAATKKALLDVGNELWAMPGDTSGLVSALTIAAANATATNPYTIHCATYLYTISATLDIPSYTTLDLHGGILKGDGSTLVSIARNAGWTSGNTHITIKNGTIDWNDTVRGSATGVETMGIRFSNTDNLTLTNLKLLDAQKYACLLHLCDYVTIDDIYFNTNSDGIHISNGGKFHKLNNLKGYCGDDFVAYTHRDWAAYEVNTTFDNFYDISVTNLFMDNTSKAAFKMIGNGGAPFTNTGITDNGDGTYTVTCGTHPIVTGDEAWVVGATPSALNGKRTVTAYDATSWTFALATGTGNSTVHGTSRKQYYSDNIVVDGLFGTCQNIPIKLGEDTADVNKIDYQHIKTITFRNMPIRNYASTCVQFLCTTSVNIDDITFDIGGKFQVTTSKSFIAYSGGVAPTIKNIRLKNATFWNTTQNQGVVINATIGSVNNLFVDSVVCDTLSVFLTQTAGAWVGTHVYLNGFEVKGSNTGFQVRDELHLHFANTRHTGNLNRLALNSGAGANLYAYGHIYDVGTDNRSLEDAGVGTISCFGMIKANTTDIQAVAGTYFIDAATGRHYSWNGTTNAAIN